MSEVDFNTAVRHLHESASVGDSHSDSFESANRIDEAEHELRVDYFLGKDLAASKREALLLIHRNMAQSRTTLIKRLLRRQISNLEYSQRIQSLVKKTAEEFAKVLTAQEYLRFYGDSVQSENAIPLDPALMPH